MTLIMRESYLVMQKNTLIKIKVMTEDVVMTVRYFSKKVSCDLKKTLKMTLEGILYSRGVKVRKFQLVSNVEVY